MFSVILDEKEAAAEQIKREVLSNKIIDLIVECGNFKTVSIYEKDIRIKSKYFAGFIADINLSGNSLQYFRFTYRNRTHYIHNPAVEGKQDAVEIVRFLSEEVLKYIGDKAYERDSVGSEFRYLIENLQIY